MPRKKATKAPDGGTTVSKDIEVVLPNGKTKTLRADVEYKNLPSSVLDQIK